MSRMDLIPRPGRAVFYTVALADQRSDLLVREINQLRWVVGQVLFANPVDVLAWVVLPNHMHAVWQLPPGDSTDNGRWPRIQRGISKDFGPVWSDVIRERELKTASDIAAHMRYCQMDPVRHGLVDHPREWAFSSFHKERIANGNFAQVS